MTDTEAIALRADRARERHVERVPAAPVDFPTLLANAIAPVGRWCSSCGHHWPCDAASLAADIPELLARVVELEGALRAWYEAVVAYQLLVASGPVREGEKPDFGPYDRWQASLRALADLARALPEPKP